jgi:prepilin signal peptidase PulO-like enzyme (type II secretory pathway)
MDKKEIIAFAISPLVPVLLFILGIIIWQFDIAAKHGYGSFFTVNAGLAALDLIISYTVILFVVAPLYYVLTKRSKVSKFVVYVIAGITGAVIITTVSVMFGADESLELLPAIIIGALLGETGGYVFLRVLNMPRVDV